MTIHRRDCPNILRTEEHDRLIEVDWGTDKKTYPVLVRIRAYADPTAYAVDGAMDDLIKLATSQIDRHKIDLALSADCLVLDGDQALPISYQQALTMLASELDVDDSDGLLLPGESVTVKLAGLQDAEVSFDPEAQVYSFRLATSAGGGSTPWRWGLPPTR